MSAPITEPPLRRLHFWVILLGVVLLVFNFSGAKPGGRIDSPFAPAFAGEGRGSAALSYTMSQRLGMTGGAILIVVGLYISRRSFK